MNLQKIRDLVASVPTEDFIENIFTDETGKCCLVGHVSRLLSKDPTDYSIGNCNPHRTENYEAKELIELSHHLLLKKGVTNQQLNNEKAKGGNFYITLRDAVFAINNGFATDIYQQESVKERGLALLDDLIADSHSIQENAKDSDTPADDTRP